MCMFQACCQGMTVHIGLLPSNFFLPAPNGKCRYVTDRDPVAMVPPGGSVGFWHVGNEVSTREAVPWSYLCTAHSRARCRTAF